MFGGVYSVHKKQNPLLGALFPCDLGSDHDPLLLTVKDRTMSKLKVLELFSGTGAFSQGFIKAGFEVIAANDIWKPAQKTYCRNHPGVKFIFGDIAKRSVKERIIECFPKGKKCDVIVGGPPCQAYSMAGLRDPNDPRGRFFEEYVELVHQLSPKAFVMENVLGILSIQPKDGSILSKILSGFGSIEYSVKLRVLDAANYGAPQHRERVIFIGTKAKSGIDIPFPAPTHGPGLKPFQTVQEAIDDISDMPEDTKFSHIFTKHSIEFIEKIELTPIGEAVNPKYRGAFFRTPPDEPCKTTMGNHGGCFVHYRKNRCLTPRESARLQGFHDNFLFKGTKHDIFAMIGNAIPFHLAYAIAKTISGVL